MAVLPPLLRLGLAHLTGRRVRCVGILGLGAEEFTLRPVMSLTSLPKPTGNGEPVEVLRTP